MSLEKIQSDVLAAAQKEAEHILKAAEQASRERVAREVDAIRRGEEHRYEINARALAESASRAITQAKGEAAKKVLARRNAVLDAVFAEAKKQIAALPPDIYAMQMRKRLETAAGSHGGKVRVHAEDRIAMSSILVSLNAGRAENARVALDEDGTLPTRGGFLFIAPAYEVDQTLDTLVQELQHELAPQLASEIFAG
ncbi:MAG: hypothetical protein IT366_00300 [Candidatus Hydrogenedentes bacterium]|nr:hypothetical protein [Candidatus Hydrogenedentota bacterium]